MLVQQERSVKIPMITVRGGSFIMGLSHGLDFLEQDLALYDLEQVLPVHQVAVSSFMMAVTEVTQLQYHTVMDEKPSSFKNGSDAPQRPVENVSWFNAVLYCNELSKLEGLECAYYNDQTFRTEYTRGSSVFWKETSTGYRLPTEAEWEYAARGGIHSKAYAYAGSNNINMVAWYNDNSRESTHPVAVKAPNELGLYDMNGNVNEWCWDLFNSYGTEGKPDTVKSRSDLERVVRGGSWNFKEFYPGVAFRHGSFKDMGRDDIGFRLVRSLFS